jgi:hypothetical protein
MCSRTLTVNALPTCEITGNNAICAGGSTSFSGPAGMASYSWTGPGGFTANTQSTGTISTAGTYNLTITDSNGCSSMCSRTLTVNALPTCEITGNNAICAGGSTSFSGPAGMASYSWTGPGGFTANTQSTGTISTAGTYNLTITDSNGCSSMCSRTLTVNSLPTCLINQPSQPPICGTTGNSLTAAAGGATYAWSVSGAGWSVTAGQGTNTISYTAGTGTATFTLTVTGANGCTSTCTREVTCTTPQGEFCTLTQGAYGNRNGVFNGLRRDALIAQLLNGAPLTIGKSGVRSITFANNAASTVTCIIDSMPAGGTASAFPASLGNVSIPPSTCSALAPVTGGKGRFRNVLIGQTLALSLNLRLDTHGLGSWNLCGTFVTKRTLQDVGQTFTIPSSVLTALTNLGLPQTVNGLLELANRALAGQPTGGANLSNINAAVDAINTGFDECRILVSCNGSVVYLNAPNGLDWRSEESGRPADFAAFVNPLDSFGSIMNTRYPLGRETGVAAGFEAEPVYSFRDWLLPSLRNQRR